jgi:putative phosphoesterase
LRLALISDTHGNSTALDAVLAELDAQAVSEVVCLGDVASDGPDPAGCVERIRALGCPVVLGNTDAAWGSSSAPQGDDHWLNDIDRWGREQLTSEQRAWLAGLPPTLSLEVEGHSLLCFHGSPRSFDDVILAATPATELMPMVAGAEEELLAGGHTHQQMVRRFRSSTIVNPGTVGLPFDAAPLAWPPTLEEQASIRNRPAAEYALLTVEEGRFSIDLRSTAYPLDDLIALARGSGMPHADRWAADWR